MQHADPQQPAAVPLRPARSPPSNEHCCPPLHPPTAAGLCNRQAYELVRNNIATARLSVPLSSSNFDYWLGRCQLVALSTSGCPPG